MDHHPNTYTPEQIYGPMPLSDEAFDAILNESLFPRPSTMLAEKMGLLGLGPQHILLDIGCRDAGHSLRLVEAYGCNLVGVDPLECHMEAGQALLDAYGFGPKTTLRQGTIEAIPADDLTFDYIWCRDMLSHVVDLATAFGECYRVLKQGGQMLIYVTLATDLLEAREALRIFPALGVVPSSARAAEIEAAFTQAGFSMVEKDPVGSEWREHWEEDGTHMTAQQLLRIARMLRNRDAYIQQIGLEQYEIELANCHWGVYQMLGKLCPTVYVIKRPA